MERKLYVGNLNFHTTEAMLAEAFAEAGYATVSVKVITDRETGRSRGFAFVELADEQTAEAALAKMHDKLVDGRPLKVTEAKPRGAGGFSGPPRGPGGPGGPGGDFRPPRPRPSFEERGASGAYEGRGGGRDEGRGGSDGRSGSGGYDGRGPGGGGGHEGRGPGGYEGRGPGGGGGYEGRGPGGGYEGRGPAGGGAPDGRGGYESRPRFGGDAGRGPRDAGGFGGGPRSFGGFPPPQPPGFGQTTDEEAKGDPRVNRGKRRDLSKQHAERQEADDDDGWA